MFFRAKINFLAQFLLTGVIGFGMPGALVAAENPAFENSEIKIHQNEVDRVLAISISQTKTFPDWFVADDEIFAIRSAANSDFGPRKSVQSPKKVSALSAEVEISELGCRLDVSDLSFPAISFAWNESFDSFKTSDSFFSSSLYADAANDFDFSLLKMKSHFWSEFRQSANAVPCSSARSKLIPAFFEKRRGPLFNILNSLGKGPNRFRNSLVFVEDSDRMAFPSLENGVRELFASDSLQKRDVSRKNGGGRKTERTVVRSIPAESCGNSPATESVGRSWHKSDFEDFRKIPGSSPAGLTTSVVVGSPTSIDYLQMEQTLGYGDILNSQPRGSLETKSVTVLSSDTNPFFSNTENWFAFSFVILQFQSERIFRITETSSLCS